VISKTRYTGHGPQVFDGLYLLSCHSMAIPRRDTGKLSGPPVSRLGSELGTSWILHANVHGTNTHTHTHTHILVNWCRLHRRKCTENSTRTFSYIHTYIHTYWNTNTSAYMHIWYSENTQEWSVHHIRTAKPYIWNTGLYVNIKTICKWLRHACSITNCNGTCC
jgi:hypothetical protein